MLEKQRAQRTPETKGVWSGSREILTGYSVMVARVLWEDLVSVRVRVPRHNLRGCSLMAEPLVSNQITWVRFPSPAPFDAAQGKPKQKPPFHGWFLLFNSLR